MVYNSIDDYITGKPSDDQGDETGGETEIVELEIGDYVDYKPQQTVKSYLFENKYTGYDTNQTLNQENLEWRVLDINEDGTVELVSATETEGKLYLYGALGYNNAVYLLNDYCKKLYSNDALNATARSVKIEDIQDRMDLTVWDYHGSAAGSVGTNGKNVHIVGDYAVMEPATKYYPSIWTQENTEGNKVAGSLTNGTLGISEQKELTTETYTKMETSGIDATLTLWYTENLKSNNFKNEKIYELLIKSKKNWIASRGTALGPRNELDFRIFGSYGFSLLYSIGLYGSFSTTDIDGPNDRPNELSHNATILPIVTVPATNVKKIK